MKHGAGSGVVQKSCCTGKGKGAKGSDRSLLGVCEVLCVCGVGFAQREGCFIIGLCN